MSKFKNELQLKFVDIISAKLTLSLVGIDWANGPYVMEPAIDVTGGTNYSVMGANQISKIVY